MVWDGDHFFVKNCNTIVTFQFCDFWNIFFLSDLTTPSENFCIFFKHVIKKLRVHYGLHSETRGGQKSEKIIIVNFERKT